MNYDELSGRRVMVTGATGFLGSHVVAALARAGALVLATRRNASRQPAVPVPPVTWREIDLTNGTQVAAEVAVFRPSLVIHLAAYGARAAQREPGLLFDVNVRGTWLLLQALPPDARLVMTGTCAEYGPLEAPAHEGLPCRPASAYAAAKHAAVTLVTGWAREGRRQAVILRPYGPFGPGDDPTRVLPTAIAGLLKGDEVILTDGGQLRDFSYIDDHVDAVLRAATAPNLSPGAIYNIGSGTGVTVKDALQRVAAIIGGPGRLRFGARPGRPDDLRALVADVGAARRDLGFVAKVSFEDGIARTVAAMRAARQV